MKARKIMYIDKKIIIQIQKKAKKENRSFSNTIETILRQYFSMKNIRLIGNQTRNQRNVRIKERVNEKI